MTILDQPYQTSAPMVYASFGERLVARIIDVVILIIPAVFIPFLAPWLYFAIQEGSASGATIGKRAMGIKVVSTEGRPIGFGTATGRFFGHIVNHLTLFIGYFLILFNARNQGLHDMMTNTVVVKADAVAPAPRRATQQRGQKHSWTRKVSDSEMHFVEINTEGGRHWHRTALGEQVHDFTLWQLTDGMVDLSEEFGPEVFREMKQYAEHVLRSKA